MSKGYKEQAADCIVCDMSKAIKLPGTPDISLLAKAPDIIGLVDSTFLTQLGDFNYTGPNAQGKNSLLDLFKQVAAYREQFTKREELADQIVDFMKDEINRSNLNNATVSVLASNWKIVDLLRLFDHTKLGDFSYTGPGADEKNKLLDLFKQVAAQREKEGAESKKLLANALAAEIVNLVRGEIVRLNINFAQISNQDIITLATGSRRIRLLVEDSDLEKLGDFSYDHTEPDFVKKNKLLTLCRQVVAFQPGTSVTIAGAEGYAPPSSSSVYPGAGARAGAADSGAQSKSRSTSSSSSTPSLPAVRAGTGNAGGSSYSHPAQVNQIYHQKYQKGWCDTLTSAGKVAVVAAIGAGLVLGMWAARVMQANQPLGRE